MHRWNPAREHSQHFDDIICLTPRSHLPPLCVETSLLSLREWSRRWWKSESKLGRGGAARKQMKREKALLGEAEGGWLRYDLRLAHTYTQEGKRDRILQRIKSFAAGLFCCRGFLFKFETKFAEVYPSPFWILLCWNGDAWLCGLASGQQALVKNTSLTGQLYSSFIPRSVFDARAQAVWKAQLGSTSWISLPDQLLTLLFDTSLTITCGR